jgi:hypothetical protein|tara:strand:- start:123 stop:344 length:222 start_codon:yes stop_codon:yes gene_type:complete
VIKIKGEKAIKRIVYVLTHYGKYSTRFFDKIAFQIHAKPTVYHDFSETMTPTGQTDTGKPFFNAYPASFNIVY